MARRVPRRNSWPTRSGLAPLPAAAVGGTTAPGPYVVDQGLAGALGRQDRRTPFKDLAGRLKEAEPRFPAVLMTAHRLILVPAKNKTPSCFDLGIAGYMGKTTLSSRVSEKLLGEQQLFEKLDPGILIGER